MPLINDEISLMLAGPNNSFLVADTAVNEELTFTINDTKFYIRV